MSTGSRVAVGARGNSVEGTWSAESSSVRCNCLQVQAIGSSKIGGLSIRDRGAPSSFNLCRVIGSQELEFPCTSTPTWLASLLFLSRGENLIPRSLTLQGRIKSRQCQWLVMWESGEVHASTRYSCGKDSKHNGRTCLF